MKKSTSKVIPNLKVARVANTQEPRADGVHDTKIPQCSTLPAEGWETSGKTCKTPINYENPLIERPDIEVNKFHPLSDDTEIDMDDITPPPEISSRRVEKHSSPHQFVLRILTSRPLSI